MRAANAVALQKNHDVPHALLRRPRFLDPLGAFGTDPVHFPQPCRKRVDHFQRALAEFLDNPVGERLADAFDQAAAEILLDANDRARQHGLESLDRKLSPPLFVVHPMALGADALANIQRREIAYDGDRLGPPRAAFRQKLRHGVMVLLVGVNDMLQRAFNGLQWFVCRGHQRVFDVRGVRP